MMDSKSTGGTFVVNAGDGVSDPLPHDASSEQILGAFEQAKARSTVADKSKFPTLVTADPPATI